MAVLYVTEFAHLAYDASGLAAVAQQPPLNEQTVAIGATSVAIAVPFNMATGYVRLHSDVVCSVEFGSAPVATAAKARMAANQTEYHAVPRGSGWSVAVITNT